MNTTITATKARKGFFKLLEQANRPGKSVTITVDGEPKVVMMSSDEFEGWLETMEIMQDKKLVKDIKEGIKESKGKKFYTHDQVKKMIKNANTV